MEIVILSSIALFVGITLFTLLIIGVVFALIGKEGFEQSWVRNYRGRLLRALDDPEIRAKIRQIMNEKD